MPAHAPTILATSGGFRDGTRLLWEVGPLTRYAVELAGVTVGRRGCASSGPPVPTILDWSAPSTTTPWREGWIGSHLALLPLPNIADARAHLLAQDLIWVWGGSVAGLLALWRLHGLDRVLREAWEAGVVLTGVSAGSLCCRTSAAPPTPTVPSCNR